MFNLPPGCIPLEVFNLPDNEFLQNLACTLWVPVWFTTASIKDLGRFSFSWFHGVPPLDFFNRLSKNFNQKTQRGDPMKSWKWKLSQIFNIHCGEPYRYPQYPCQVSKKIIIGKVEMPPLVVTGSNLGTSFFYYAPEFLGFQTRVILDL